MTEYSNAYSSDRNGPANGSSLQGSLLVLERFQRVFVLNAMWIPLRQIVARLVANEGRVSAGLLSLKCFLEREDLPPLEEDTCQLNPTLL